MSKERQDPQGLGLFRHKACTSTWLQFQMARYQKLLAKYNLLTWESSTPSLLKLLQSFRVNLRAHCRRTGMATTTDMQARCGELWFGGKLAGCGFYHKLNLARSIFGIKGESWNVVKDFLLNGSKSSQEDVWRCILWKIQVQPSQWFHTKASY